MSTVTKNQILNEIETQKQSIADWKTRQSEEALSAIEANNMVPCVYKMQRSPRKWMVSWRFTKQGTEVSSIQQAAHTEPYMDIEIMWVAS